MPKVANPEYQQFMDLYTNQDTQLKIKFESILNAINTSTNGELYQISGATKSGKTSLQQLFNHPMLTVSYPDVNDELGVDYDVINNQPWPKHQFLTNFIKANQHNNLNHTTATIWIKDFNQSDFDTNHDLNQTIMQLRFSIPNLNFVLDGTEENEPNLDYTIREHYVIPNNDTKTRFNDVEDIFTQKQFQKLILK